MKTHGTEKAYESKGSKWEIIKKKTHNFLSSLAKCSETICRIIAAKGDRQTLIECKCRIKL